MSTRIMIVCTLFFVLAACAPTPVAPTTAVPATAAPPLPSTTPTLAPTQDTAPVSTEATAVPAATPIPEPTVAPTPSGPEPLSSGQFTKIDRAHAAEGTVTLYRQPDGSLLLRLEQDFRSNPGPDLYVGLSGHPMPRNNDELHNDGYLELALMQSIEGPQDFLLPADLDLSAYKSVVIYCKEFTVLFSTAELQ